ncbi:hypothetical protein RIF29_38256 [Crotalaria pallida]|uniref:RNase H type-1 domain-containing protein n=1 Tax=Crotalaria pallida TaxID=3830 RepID=A0AAN9DZB7_CROPI
MARRIFAIQNEISLCCLQGGAHQLTQGCMVKWNKPPPNYFALNVDGSAMGNPGEAGLGGVFRSEDGDWLCGFSGHIGFTNNLHMEILAILQGLRLPKSLHIRLLVCQSDSMEAIHWLAKQGAKEMDNLKIWHSLPEALFAIFLADKFPHIHHTPHLPHRRDHPR